MNWMHVLFAVVLLVGGYYLGSKHPGLLTKATGGAVSA